MTRLLRRAARLVVGDRVLLPPQTASTMWHLGTVRHRIRGGTLVVRFDNLDADIAVDARSDLAMRAIGEGVYERELLGVLPALCGDGDLVNVGANVGIVAIALARVAAPGKQVLCVEPIPECFRLLEANLRGAGVYGRTIVLEGFAAEHATGLREMWTVPGKPEYSSGGAVVHKSVIEDRKARLQVPVVRLDDAIGAAGLSPSAIVMDCEGGECGALRGATATLRTHRPTLILEFDPPLIRANGSDTADFIRFLGDHGYGCLSLDAAGDVIGAEFTGTVVAAPSERVAEVRRRVVEVVDAP